MKIDAYEKQLLAIINELIGYLRKSGVDEQDAQDIAQESLKTELYRARKKLKQILTEEAKEHDI